LQDRTIRTTVDDIFYKKRLPGSSPVRAMVEAVDFRMFSRREHPSPFRKEPGEFVGSDVH